MKDSIVNRAMIIEDSTEIQLSAKLLLRGYFDEVDAFNHPRYALNAMKQHRYDVILLDMNFTRGMDSGVEGLACLREILKLDPDSTVILMTAYADVDLAIRSMKAGAFDFIIKPWNNDKFLNIIRDAIKFNQAKHIRTSIVENPDIIGRSPLMQEVMRIAEKVAVTDAGVLLLGENGTGKGLIAEHIHSHSKRKDGPFIKVDLGSISESLFESEMFGHVKGAFTDAKENRMGWFEQANGGTLFLDEIGNLSLPLQAKLLNAIQSSSITRVGSSKRTELNIRLVCATNADLDSMCTRGEFRRDLLYRINTVSIHLPPLRLRGDDVCELAAYFLDQFRHKYERNEIRFSDDAIESIKSYSWPGNIRELQHSVERAVILCDGNIIRPDDLIVVQTNSSERIETSLLTLEELEQSTIRNALSRNGGVIAHAAKELGLTRASLYRRLEKYGLS